MLEIQEKPRFQKRVSSTSTSKFPKAGGDRLSNSKLKNQRGTNSLIEKPKCGKCRKKHYGACLIGMDKFFICGKIRFGIALK